MTFGAFLIQKNKLSSEDIISALQVQKFRKIKLGRLLVEMGKLSELDCNNALFEYFYSKEQIAYESWKEKIKIVPIDKSLQELLKLNQLIPVHVNDHQIEVLGKNLNDRILEELENTTQKEIKPVIIEEQLFDLLFSNNRLPLNHPQNIILSMDLTSDQKLQEKDPYVKVLYDVFKDAKRHAASDIHFEPYDQEYLIRLRVHGKLQDWKKLEPLHGMSLTSKLKWLINMDLGIIGSPQDSRASFHTLGIDIRGSSMPVTNGGEKIVLRLQYNDQKINIQTLGIRPHKLNILLESITKSDGLILISGPTGSGKTTTLYGLLEEMDRLGKNISTLENPVEKQLARINQANIGDHKDFASFQRALMRQDPDVILLGEIRDQQTAELSLKLASTGHLVLSTIHANGALQVVDRLTNLGADLFSIKTNLRLSVAQRLLRLLCPNCSMPAPHDLVQKTGLTGEFKVLNPAGCKSCTAGIIGRKAVIECLQKEDFLPLGVQPVLVKESLAFECTELALKGEIDVRDALFFT